MRRGTVLNAGYCMIAAAAALAIMRPCLETTRIGLAEHHEKEGFCDNTGADQRATPIEVAGRQSTRPQSHTKREVSATSRWQVTEKLLDIGMTFPESSPILDA
jgi:hypothetical protein